MGQQPPEETHSEILVVDDEQFNLMATQDVLNTVGMSCVTAVDGLQAI